ncbi:MAG: cytochrome P450 [Cyanobacteria bacterium K_Offshore_surface_m2_239]|nr:cytochrome P450 [Cyanobacteria bacterium K_Offshore_surface_m2_239]
MPLPPGPATWGPRQLIQWIRSPYAVMRDCAATYGDVFTLKVAAGAEPVVFCSDPDGLRLMLGNDEGPTITAPGELNAIFSPLLGPQSVIGLSDDPHRRMRQLLMPPFHGERMRSYGEVIDAITAAEADGWPLDAPVAARGAMQRISMRVILRAVFGLREGERLERLEQGLVTLLDTSSQPLSTLLIFVGALQKDLGPLSPWGRFLRRRQAVDDLLYAEIAERRAHPERRGDDILSLLLDARDAEGQGLTDGELRDELMTLLVAGHETTATALSWALHWLATRPEVQRRLREELREARTAPDAPVELATLLRLPYLQAVCHETLRIYPVGMITFPRRLETPLTLGGHPLEAGTVVMGCIFLAHRREEVFADPEEFLPERFLANSFSPSTFLPFGGGSRRCIGMAFALFEMKAVLSELLRRFTVEIDPRTPLPVRPERRGLTSGISPLWLRVSPVQEAARPVS